jgi:pimeloyl-ACP methyl ester carboxylesterase
MPHGEEKVPLTFVFCGHGADGRLTPGYPLMAERLARRGMAVMIPDNIGQGDRSAYGHNYVVAPFYCGLTLQGMILMESVALIRQMAKHPRVDSTRMGACGNSGGGTLCLFLAALAPELSALCATGYPSEFSYILSKERRHCACNLLPGCAHSPEMWEVLSAFAPKPLLLEQGKFDDLIPYDLFLRNARKVENVYRQMGVADQFKAMRAETLHPWVSDDRDIIEDFLCEKLGVEGNSRGDDETLPLQLSNWHVALPEDGVTTEQLAQKLSGKTMPEGVRLSDIFVPTYQGNAIKEEEIIPDIGRGEVMRVLAQMECALKKMEG